MAESKFDGNGTVSLFSYRPERELDYGTLMCWSRNAVGEQAKPCVFHIIAAGRPDPVKNCSIANITSSSFQVQETPRDWVFKWASLTRFLNLWVILIKQFMSQI